jgi:hypothetical protein
MYKKLVNDLKGNDRNLTEVLSRWDWGKLRKALRRKAGALAEFWTKHLSDTNLYCYRYA